LSSLKHFHSFHKETSLSVFFLVLVEWIKVSFYFAVGFLFN